MVVTGRSLESTRAARLCGRGKVSTTPHRAPSGVGGSSVLARPRARCTSAETFVAQLAQPLTTLPQLADRAGPGGLAGRARGVCAPGARRFGVGVPALCVYAVRLPRLSRCFLLASGGTALLAVWSLSRFKTYSSVNDGRKPWKPDLADWSFGPHLALYVTQHRATPEQFCPVWRAP